ncbi:MAG: acyl-ACP thioesterase domain-containing protein [Solirubrobacteraceae bacterium]
MSEHAAAPIPMIDPPDGARMFALEMQPLLADCAPSGRIRLDALARWVQDVAHADMAAAQLETAVVWVVRRTRIRVERFPRFGERLLVQTFASGLARMWAERRTTVRAQPGIAGPLAGDPAEAPLVEAVTLWIHLDRVRLVPTPLSPAVFETYAATAGDRRFSHRLVHPRPEAVEPDGEWIFRRADLDLADHVNNAAYWELLEEGLLAEPGDPASVDAEVEYRLPAQPGPATVKRAGDYTWLTDPRSDEIYASMLLSATRGRRG